MLRIPVNLYTFVYRKKKLRVVHFGRLMVQKIMSYSPKLARVDKMMRG